MWRPQTSLDIVAVVGAGKTPRFIGFEANVAADGGKLNRTVEIACFVEIRHVPSQHGTAPAHRSWKEAATAEFGPGTPDTRGAAAAHYQQSPGACFLHVAQFLEPRRDSVLRSSATFVRQEPHGVSPPLGLHTLYTARPLPESSPVLCTGATGRRLFKRGVDWGRDSLSRRRRVCFRLPRPPSLALSNIAGGFETRRGRDRPRQGTPSASSYSLNLNA